MTSQLKQVQDVIIWFGLNMTMNTKKPNRKRSDYDEVRNRLIVFLVKVHGWEPIDVKEALAAEYGQHITRQRVRTIYNLYSHLYTKSSFKGYKPPEKL